MKVREIKLLLHEAQAILDHCNDEWDIRELLRFISGSLKTSSEISVTPSPRERPHHEDATRTLLDRLSHMNVSEVDQTLHNVAYFRTKSDLFEFAKHLGLHVTTRQTKAALIQSILQHYELKRMDQHIKNRHALT